MERFQAAAHVYRTMKAHGEQSNRVNWNISNMVTPRILDNKHISSKSVFAPTVLLREARRQKGIEDVDVPPVCILDPDGDLARRLRQSGAAKPLEGWPCTELHTFELGGIVSGSWAAWSAHLSPISSPKNYSPVGDGCS
ncbi:MAG TPA: hypothetical protein VGL12_09410 [Roseiarcus sp.]